MVENSFDQVIKKETIKTSQTRNKNKINKKTRTEKT